MEWYWVVAIVVGSLAILFALSNIFYKQFFKRFYDVVLSGIALIVLSPLLLILPVSEQLPCMAIHSSFNRDREKLIRKQVKSAFFLGEIQNNVNKKIPMVIYCRILPV